MKLTELNPCWVSAGGEGVRDKDGNPVPEREGIGLGFDCPCGCGEHVFVAFANPMDGRSPHVSHPPGQRQPTWQRAGETFETLTLTPSILRNQSKGGCGWHGFITNGEIRPA